MTAMMAIKTKNLTKKYGSFTAVSNLNLEIENKKIFGLLGPNGSGKTTILLMLLGLTEATSGSCKVYGYDPMKSPLEVKRVLGYLPEKIGLYENLTATQNLKYIARLNKMPLKIQNERIKESLGKVGLSKQADLEVHKFSRGMKQRLGIANVLVKEPKIAFLDEPTQGIDPNGVREILDILLDMNREKNVTILISSHLIHHVQEICDEVGIIVNGKMNVQSRHADFGWQKARGWLIDVQAKNLTDIIIDKISSISSVSEVELTNDSLLVQSNKDIRSDISKIIIENNASLLSLKLRERSLDEIYKIYSR